MDLNVIFVKDLNVLCIECSQYGVKCPRNELKCPLCGPDCPLGRLYSLLYTCLLLGPACPLLYLDLIDLLGIRIAQTERP